jgi:hypothetical protein
MKGEKIMKKTLMILITLNSIISVGIAIGAMVKSNKLTKKNTNLQEQFEVYKEAYFNELNMNVSLLQELRNLNDPKIFDIIKRLSEKSL